MSNLVPLELRALIKSTLLPLNLYSPAAEELLMATCAQESLMGKYRHQVNGPAIGIFQMEPGDFNDIWQNFLKYQSRLGDEIAALASTQPPRPIEMQDNDPFAIAMARVHYYRVPHPLPDPSNLEALWTYYKTYYNSMLGAATREQFVTNYKLTGGSAS
jgi:hypothetical protein